MQRAPIRFSHAEQRVHVVGLLLIHGSGGRGRVGRDRSGCVLLGLPAVHVDRDVLRTTQLGSASAEHGRLVVEQNREGGQAAKAHD